MSSRYFPHIQALRAVAVLGPVFVHLWPARVPLSAYTSKVTGLGLLGVELFFVISGFLITGILLDARDGGATRPRVLGAFYARRVLRIFPVYWLTLVVLAALGIPGVGELFWLEFFYLTNFVIAHYEEWIGPTSHFWSLAVEEQFYLFWPLVILFLPRRALLPVMVLAIVAAPAFRWYCLAYLSGYHALVLMPACLDILGLGAVLAWLTRHRESHPVAYTRFLAVAWIGGLLGTAVHLWWYLHSWDALLWSWPLARTSYGLLFVAVVAQAARGFKGTLRTAAEWPPVVYLGTISYGVYIFHNFMSFLPVAYPPLGALAQQAPVGFFLIQVGVTIALAALSWELLESPLNALRRYFPYDDAGNRGER